MIDPTVRRATTADAGPLRVLESEARATLVGARGGTRWLEDHPPVGDAWAAVVGERSVFVAVLDVGDVVPLDVGYLVLDVDGPLARIEQVFVTPDARELGFGDALLELATAAAVESGARVLEGESLPGDRDTKNLYERAGITARLITVSRRLH